jgi:hypothetical protein
MSCSASHVINPRLQRGLAGPTAIAGPSGSCGNHLSREAVRGLTAAEADVLRHDIVGDRWVCPTLRRWAIIQRR